MTEILKEKWRPAIEFLGNCVPEEKILACCEELEYIREKYLNDEFKTNSPFSMNGLHSDETESFHEEIKNIIKKFSYEKNKI